MLPGVFTLRKFVKICQKRRKFVYGILNSPGTPSRKYLELLVLTHRPHSISCKFALRRVRTELQALMFTAQFTPITFQRTGTKTKRHHSFRIQALDAAQPFDDESKLRTTLEQQKALTIGVIGFGNFGQFLTKRFVQRGHSVIATSRGNYSEKASDMGVKFFQDADDFCEEHPDVVIVCTSILSTESTLRNFPLQRLKRNTLFCDVLSVKQFPKQLFTQLLPDNFDILCLHPMFGPDSGKDSWKNLPLVFDKVRIGQDSLRAERCANFLEIFESEGCRMVEMSCEEHDRQAASSQFITHTVGRMLGTMELAETTISTKGFESLRSLVDNTYNDSFELYYGLFMYNKNATTELSRLEFAFAKVKSELFDRLHERIRNDVFDE